MATLLAGVLVAVTPGPAVRAAGFTVTTTADTPDAVPGDGVCADSGGSCSLRAAVTEANAHAGDDIVDVPAGTFTVSLAGTEDADAGGDHDVNPADGAVLTVTGAGAGRTIVDAGGLDRVFHVVRGTAVLSGLTIRGGSVAGAGGGVLVAPGASLTLRDSALVANAAGDGAALRNDGTTTLTRVLVTESSGTGITIAGGSGALTVANSTVSGNANGGVQSGGGGSVGLTHVTVTGNGGPGISVPGGTVTLRNSVVSGNAGDECSPAGAVGSQGYNVVEDGSCGPVATDRPGSDPRLGPLAGNGGPTATHLPQPGSPAIDLVAEGSCPVSDDQRGEPRPRDGDGNGTALCDAGAVEVGGGAPPSPATTTTTPSPAPGPSATLPTTT